MKQPQPENFSHLKKHYGHPLAWVDHISPSGEVTHVEIECEKCFETIVKFESQKSIDSKNFHDGRNRWQTSMKSKK